MTKVIGILSLKGGVGKTSSVVALGHAISSFGKKVLLVDGNLSAPNLGLHLNLIEPEKTLHHVLGGKVHAKDSIHELENFDVLPASVFNNSKISPLKLKNKLGYLKRRYDFILIDSPPSINEEALGVINASDEIFVVTTPDLPTLGMTLKTAKMIRQKGLPLNGLILNKVYGKNFELSVKHVEDTSDIPVMAVVPHDINVPRALSKFKSVVDYKPKSEGSEEFRRLAAALLKEKYKPIRMKSFFRWINPKKQDINRTVFYERIFSD